MVAIAASVNHLEERIHPHQVLMICLKHEGLENNIVRELEESAAVCFLFDRGPSLRLRGNLLSSMPDWQ
jgi:hypothetical protein